jgi:hypothetical protein
MVALQRYECSKATMLHSRHPPQNDDTPPPSGRRGAVGAADQAGGFSSTSRLRVRFGSTGMPGPVVVETVTFFR